MLKITVKPNPENCFDALAVDEAYKELEKTAEALSSAIDDMKGFNIDDESYSFLEKLDDMLFNGILEQGSELIYEGDMTEGLVAVAVNE